MRSSSLTTLMMIAINYFDGNGSYVDDTRLTTEEEEEEVTPTGGRSSNAMSMSSTALRERGD